MTAFALTLVLIAAVLHATWNLCAKRAGGGLPFVALVSLIICVCYVPVLAGYWVLYRPELSAGAVVWIIGSGVLKTGYSLFLQRSYRVGDFSLIYPLARGTGPLLSTLAAIALLGERPSPLAIAGGVVIITAIFWMTGGFSIARRLPGLRTVGASGGGSAPDQTEQDVKAETARLALYRAIRYGIGSGLFIASYTLWDRRGVHTLGIPPVIYDAGTAFCILAATLPLAVRRWPEVTRHWREHRLEAFGMAILSPAAYVLVLTAMQFTPVSYVAPAREVSIVIGAFIGAKYLKEADGKRRVWAAVAMAAGVIALALG